MSSEIEPWVDGSRIIKLTSGELMAMDYEVAEGWIDYKWPASESAEWAYRAIRNMMQSATKE